MRRLIEEHGGATNRCATTLDLQALLHAESLSAQHALIDEWLGKVTLYDFRIESAVSEGSRVTVTIRARKTLEADGGTAPTAYRAMR